MSTALSPRWSPGLGWLVVVLCTPLFVKCQGGDDFFVRRENAKFTKIVDQTLEGYFKTNPVHATAAGFHPHDTEIGPIKREQIFEERRRLNDALKTLSEVQPKFLTQDNKFDYQILDYRIRGQLMDLDDIGYWARDPGYYNDLICRSIDELLQHDFAPFDNRLRAIIAREKQIPEVLGAARENIKIPPRVLAEIAAEQFNASLSYFRDFVPKSVEMTQDATLKQEFNAANDDAIRAYQDYLKYLKEVALPKARDPFFLGKKNFERTLLYDELIQISFSDLLQYAAKEVEKYQELLRDKAKAIDPQKDAQKILTELTDDRPLPDQLFVAMQSALDSARQFVMAHGLLTLSSESKPKLQEMPSFLRPMMLISLDLPGMLEAKASDTAIEASLPEKGWSRNQIDDHMRSYNTTAIQLIAIHEGFPGRYVQALRLRENPSKVRKIFPAQSFLDGWTHYSERMMVDEGFGGSDPKIRLEQLRRALVAMARLVIGMRLHVLELNYDQAVEFLIKEAYLSRPQAEREAKRAIRDPMSVLEGLGGFLIVKLKEDALKNGIPLKNFHDRMLTDGMPPGIRSLGDWSRPELAPQKKKTT